MKRILPVLLIVAAGTAVAAAGAEPWTEPDGWSAVGTVEDWSLADRHFMRIETITLTHAAKYLEVDQREAYARTLRHEHALPRVTLAEFRTLTPTERERRRAAAADALDRVVRFRNRMTDLLMRVQGKVDLGWGAQATDPTVMGDLLARLHLATGIDPRNPYAWHLLAWLSGVVGDTERAEAAHAGLRTALAAIPDDALPALRRRAHLDRAWLLRGVGDLAGASRELEAALSRDARGIEPVLLRGLLAAQTGDLNLATQCAAAIDAAPVGVFQRDWEAKEFAPAILDPLAWPERPSDYLSAWIMATAWLRDGQPDQARKALPEYRRDRHYRFGDRFWNEAAAIYEVTGRYRAATRAWTMANMYTPYFPYLVFKNYSLDAVAVSGREGALPFILAFDRFLTCGSRLAYGTALVSQATATADRDEQLAIASQALAQLQAFGSTGLDGAAAGLASAFAHAVKGEPLGMLAEANAALDALAGAAGEAGRRQALADLRSTALEALVVPGMDDEGLWGQRERSWDPAEDPAAVEARLRAAHAADPDDAAARRDLARFLVRHGDPEEGARLALAPLSEPGNASAEDIVLILEVDRLRNDVSRARQLLGRVREGGRDPWPDARLWTLVGFICLDHGIGEGRLALEYAATCDPPIPALARYLATHEP